MINDILFSNSFIFRLFEFTRHRRNENHQGVTCHYFAYMLEGTCKLTADDGTVEIREGDAFYIPNGKKYTSLWYGEPNIKFISLGFGYMPSFRSESYNTQIINCSARERELFKKIISHDSVNEVAVGEFYTLAASLIGKLTPEKRSAANELICRAEAFISDNPHLTVNELARRLAVSESALYAAFKKNSKSSIGEIKRRTLLERAKELLISTDIPIEAISSQLGFSSSSYFRKCFSERFGKSPREMRKLYTV